MQTIDYEAEARRAAAMADISKVAFICFTFALALVGSLFGYLYAVTHGY